MFVETFATPEPTQAVKPKSFLQKALDWLHPPEIVPDLSQPTLPGLVYLLRHKEHWPANFRWHYPRGEQCAMGLAHEVWGTRRNSDYLGDIFGIPRRESHRIFLRSHPSSTPGTIARKLSAYL